MIFRETTLPDVLLIEPERRYDERGFFARTFCQDEFREHNLVTEIAQCNIAFNPTRGTLRGLHYQAEPYPETRLIRCTRGAIYDVVVDLRPRSPTYCRWIAVELTAENCLSIYIPHLCAHGYLTLAENTEISYQMSEFYRPEAAAGVRWNDPAFAINLPFEPILLLARDANYPDYSR